MKRNEIYKCEICGNIVELIQVGGGDLVCCGQPMGLLVENTVDAAKEKHIPVVEKVDKGIKVTIGSVKHPMIEEHNIEWVDIICAGKTVCRHYFKPGDGPEVTFDVHDGEKVRAYCNLHGLWSFTF